MAEDIRVVLTAVDNLSGKLDQISGKLSTLGGGFSKAQANVVTLNQALALAERAWSRLVRAFEAAAAVAEAGDQMRKLELSMRAMGDTSSEAGRNVEWIKKFSTETPFGLQSVTKGFLQLRAVGIEPTAGALRAVADAVAATGGSAGEFQRAILAIGQIASKGTLSLEELRGQLAESVPGAVQILAREMQITVPQLFEKISQGAIDGKTAVDALTRGFDKAFGGAAAAQMNTFGGAVSKLSVAWTSYLAAIDTWLGVGSKLGAVINFITGAIEAQTKAIADGLDPVTQRINELNRQAAEEGRILTKVEIEQDEAIRRLRASKTDLYAQAARNLAQDREAAELAAVSNRAAQALSQGLLVYAEQLKSVYFATKLWQDEMDMVNAGAPDIVTSLVKPWQKVAQSIDEANVALGPFQFKMKDLFGANSEISQGIGKAAQGLADAVGQSGAAGGVAGAMMGAFQWFIGQLINAAFGGFLKRLEKVFGAIGEVFEELWDAGLKDLTEAAVDFVRTFKPIFRAIGTILRGVLAPVTAQLRILTDVIKNAAHIFEQLAGFIEDLADSISRITGGGGSGGGSSGVNGAGAIVGGIINGAAGAITGALMDTGGEVTGQRGLTIPGMPDHRLITARVGERYTMPGRASEPGGAGSWTINVYDSLAGTRVAEQVRLELEKMSALGKLRLT